jgi:hypothetical protein
MLSMVGFMLLTVGRLVGQAEIMRMFGVGRTQARNITLAEGFPEPFDSDLAMGKVWLRSEVTDWAASHNRVIEDDGAGGEPQE